MSFGLNNKGATITKFAFFGTGDFSLLVLQELDRALFRPSIIVCGEDKPLARKKTLTAPVVKLWAQERNIKVVQPVKVAEIADELQGCSFFALASYGKILPRSILEIPSNGTLNVHPSLLPKYRGASPLQSAILNENGTGVSIILLTTKMDAGPILAQTETNIEWPPYCDVLETVTAIQGGKMLANIIPKWLTGEVERTMQDHDLATYCVKIKKEDALLDLNDPAETNLRKICAYRDWPNAYYIHNGKKRVIVKEAHIENGILVLDKVVPEGSREMSYTEFLRGNNVR